MIIIPKKITKPFNQYLCDFFSTNLNSWKKIMEDMGIENKDEIVIYDNSDVISACRC